MWEKEGPEGRQVCGVMEPQSLVLAPSPTGVRKEEVEGCGMKSRGQDI